MIRALDYNYFKLMKFLAVVALVAIASAAECTEDELAETDPAKCTVTTPEVVAVEAEGENEAVEAADESIDCVEVEDDTECDEDDEECSCCWQPLARPSSKVSTVSTSSK